MTVDELWKGMCEYSDLECFQKDIESIRSIKSVPILIDPNISESTKFLWYDILDKAEELVDRIQEAKKDKFQEIVKKGHKKHR